MRSSGMGRAGSSGEVTLARSEAGGAGGLVDEYLTATEYNDGAMVR